MASKLSGQRVIIIGGTSGIGFAVAAVAVAEGASVVVASSRQTSVATAVARLGGGATGEVVDAGDEQSLAALFERVGSFNHLVFTAGEPGLAAPPSPIEALDIEAAKAGSRVRFWGALAAAKHARRHLDPNGSITITDGLLAYLPRKGMPLVSAFAGAAEFLVKGLAVDLAPIRVNSVCPGFIRTERFAGVPLEQLNKMTAGQPLPRAGEPEEIAEAYLYLMRGGYTTGQTLIVDGGCVLAN